MITVFDIQGSMEDISSYPDVFFKAQWSMVHFLEEKIFLLEGTSACRGRHVYDINL